MSRQQHPRAPGWETLGAAVAVMALTCLPYAVVWFFLPLGHVFPGILFNSDDHGVYLAWMRQARDGHLLFRNLFTVEPQQGVYLHVYFLLLGWLARLPGIDLPFAAHVGRVFFGIVTLVLADRLARCFTGEGPEGAAARRAVFWTTALSAGVGWLFWAERITQFEPVDVWQPEAVTFASLYTNGLFAVSLALMLGVVLCLLRAERDGARWAVAAGLCGLALGNIHSYDTVHLAAVWASYLAARWIVTRRFPARAAGLALLAAIVAAPSVAYMAWLYAAEPVFRARALVPTPTPPPVRYLLGAGALIPLALFGAAQLWRAMRQARKAPGAPSPFPLGPETALLPLCWAIVGLAVAYLPVSFQRKLIMGWHLPLALLAGLGLHHLAGVAARRLGRPRLAPLFVAAAVALMAISNLRYMERDIRLALRENRTSTGIHPAYWPEEAMRALQRAGEAMPPEATLLVSPFSVLAPAWAGRAVYAGHWGETPGFAEKVREVYAFYSGRMTGAERREFLRSRGIRYVMWGPLERALLAGGPQLRPLEAEPFLAPVFTEGEATLFVVRTDERLTGAAGPGSPAGPSPLPGTSLPARRPAPGGRTSG